MQVIDTFNDQQLKQLHQLYQQAWWSANRSLEETRRGVQGSQLCLGLINPQQALIGFARVLTDYTFKALIFDLIVHQDLRGQGHGQHLLELIKSHEKLSRVLHFELYCLPEMSDFYAAHGFSLNVDGVQLMRLRKT